MKNLSLLVVAAAVIGLTACEAQQEASEDAMHEETAMQHDDAATDHSDMDATEDASGADATMLDTDANTELNQAMELGLIIQDDKIGEGPEVKAGDIAIMHYTGWLYDESKPQKKGDKFDSSRDRGEPFPVNRLGTGRVIKGWDLGVPGMKVGGQRTLIIPSELGYGERGTPGGPIPGGATLVFDVELVEIQ
jgi:FKBP-type peptidyl-prolyl cis-trans isomerase FkpA